MTTRIWVTDREPGIRLLFGELLPEAAVLMPDELRARLAAGDEPEALVIDGTQLLELPAARRHQLLRVPRVLVCTGLALTSIPMNLVAGSGVTVLAKPFCVEDLEEAITWLRDVEPAAPMVAPGAIAATRGPRRSRRQTAH